MIEGLKLIVPGVKVQELLRIRAEHHRLRGEFYTSELARYDAAGIKAKEDTPRFSSSTSDPVTEARDKVARHAKKAYEYDFMAEFTKTGDEYLLSTADLERLGVVESRY